ncbi:MAG: hypothetical protein JXQ75_13525, partial [Phycisphaerae bacterium]|nr:hypothetical protein [Phycisphaerae bacterium]
MVDRRDDVANRRSCYDSVQIASMCREVMGPRRVYDSYGGSRMSGVAPGFARDKHSIRAPSAS